MTRQDQTAAFGLADISAIVRELEAMISTGQDIRIDIDFAVDMPDPASSREITCPECGHSFKSATKGNKSYTPKKPAAML